MPARIWKFENV